LTRASIGAHLQRTPRRSTEGVNTRDLDETDFTSCWDSFLITFVTSIAALLLFQPVLDDPIGYIAGDGSDNRIFFGGFLATIPEFIWELGLGIYLTVKRFRPSPILSEYASAPGTRAATASV
jgi:hypothetical protein